MERKPRTPRYDVKLEKVLAAASKVMANVGYEKASIRRVAGEVPISLAGLYYYCKCKDELLFLIQYHTFDKLLARLKERQKDNMDPEERLLGFIENHIAYFADNMNDLKVCSNELEVLADTYYRKVEAKRREYFEHGLEYVKGVMEGQDAERTRLVTMFLFGMLNWIHTWYRPQRKDSTRAGELARLMTETFLNGARGRGSRK
ncbi:MAG: TetR/AcrR family transcriptional regulator [Planctomycetota bacterium]|nr:TetR/AcrR family transcriptional regulator [Planctomycetota bacterium]